MIPFDLISVERRTDWRSRFAWPLSQAETQAACGSATRRLTEAIRDIADDETARIAEASAPRVNNFILPAIHAASVLNAAWRQGVELETAQPEARYLAGELEFEQIPPTFFDSQLALSRAPPLALLRRLARPRYWTPWHRLPWVLVAPQATALNPNDMLEDRARYTGRRVDFLDAAQVVRDAGCKFDGNFDKQRADDAAQVMAASAPICEEFDDGLTTRLRHYIATNSRAVCRQIAKALAALRRHKNLPMAVWNGTAGNLAGGIVASEVLRRGGNVTGFDHVTGRGLECNLECSVILELAFSSRFVVATPEAAIGLQALKPQALLHPRRNCEISGGRGYARVRALNLTEKKNSSGGALLRVTYVSPLFHGWRQSIPANMADPVQLDWELRLVEMLRTLPIELICRPHPEGLYGGRPHPLADIATVASRPFEDLLAETDLFLFDWVRSSTFWIALCTDRPIVLIEPGYSFLEHFFTNEIQEEIQKRVRFVRAFTDDRNRLVVDEGEIAEAILTSPGTVDASTFQRLLIGEVR